MQADILDAKKKNLQGDQVRQLLNTLIQLA